MARFTLFLSGAVVFFASYAPIRAAEPQQKPDVPEGMQIDARGPVHEAFAQPWQANAAPNKAVAKKPPEPIPEEPAAEKPAGKNVQWIPGYWQWDNDRNDFIWVSGIWRNMPEGRRWVAGYWTQTPEGSRWVSGHFAAAQEKDNQYVPEPPQNPDQGPTSPAPDESSSYVPGSWVYTNSGYNYRDGYWADAYADRLWVPARYIWSPYGYTYCSGYWDYPFASRGLLFAPIYFTRALWNTAGWFYRPSYAIGFGGLFGNFFVGLGYSHYYFGDYYARSYLNFGFYPWFWYSRYNYDPYWTHLSWSNRNNTNWAATQRTDYLNRVNGTAPLPPRTLSAQANAPATTRMVSTLSQLRDSGQKLEAVSQQQHTTQLQAARQMVNQSRQLSQGAPRVNVTPGVIGSSRTGVRTSSGFTPGVGAGGTAPSTGRPAGGTVPNTGRPAAGNQGVFPGGGSTGGVFPGGGRTGGVFPGGGHNVGAMPSAGDVGHGGAHGGGVHGGGPKK